MWNCDCTTTQPEQYIIYTLNEENMLFFKVNHSSDCTWYNILQNPFSSITCQRITKLMRCSAKLKDIFLYRTLEDYAASICRILLTHGWSVPYSFSLCNNRILAGASLLLSHLFSVFPFHSLSLTLQDVITPKVISLQSSYDKSKQKLHNSRGKIQNWLPKTKHACNFYLKT